MNKQKRNILVLYLSCFVVFNMIFGLTTLMWFIGWLINIVLIIISVALPIIAFVNYKKGRKQRAKVLLVVFSIFWVSYSSQRIVKHQIEKSGERKGELLVKRLEEYRAVNNKYPENIEGKEFEDLDLKHRFNSRIQYEYINDDDFIVKFRTFNITYKVYGRNGRWYYDDD